jgi:hypothetical protein
MTAASKFTSTSITTGSTKMYSMQEALARERMSESQREARISRIASQMASARRWRRLERIARSAHQRHVESVDQAAAALNWD